MIRDVPHTGETSEECSEFETELGAAIVRQLRKPRSIEINMSPARGHTGPA